MQNKIYVPVLKWKKGEQLALKELPKPQRDLITPLLEITDYLSPDTILESLNSCYSQPVYIDTIIAAQDDRDYLVDLVRQLGENGYQTYPVLYYDDLPETAQALESFIERMAYRISLPETVDGPDLSEIVKAVEEFHQSNNRILIDIILDLGIIAKENDASRQLAEVKDVLNDYFLNGSFYNKVIICSSAFPENVASVEAGEAAVFKRFDMKLFKKIINRSDFKPLQEAFIYADYGVTKFTDTELDFSKMRYGILPKIKYTTENDYIVLKGKRNKARELIIGYPELASRIVASDYYYGKDFSFGDQEIKVKASNKKGPGSNQNWVTIVANHHIAAVIDQLST